MKKLVLIAAITALFLTFADLSIAYWVWTPDTGKWINPKYAVRDTPEEQMQWAASFFKAKNYDRAAREFRQLIKHYPNTSLAPDAQYYIAKCWEEKRDYYQSYTAYQVIIDKYPYSKKIDEIIEAQYNIGNLFYSGQKAKFLGISILPAYDKASDIFKKVVENAPFGKLADLAQFKLGLCYKKQMLYQEAKDAFKKLTEQYPDSKLMDDAKYEMAICTAAISLKPSYDQAQTNVALEEFQKLQKESKIGEIRDITKEVDQLKNKLAEYNWKIGEYYRGNGNYVSAKIYYDDIIARCQNTKWALKAENMLVMISRKIIKEEHRIDGERVRFEKEQVRENAKAQKEAGRKEIKLKKEIARQNAIEEKKLQRQKKIEEARVARDHAYEAKILKKTPEISRKIEMAQKKAEEKEKARSKKLEERQKKIEEARLAKQNKIKEARLLKQSNIKQVKAMKPKRPQVKTMAQEKPQMISRPQEAVKAGSLPEEKLKTEVEVNAKGYEEPTASDEALARKERLEQMRLAKIRDDQQSQAERMLKDEVARREIVPETEKEVPAKQEEVSEAVVATLPAAQIEYNILSNISCENFDSSAKIRFNVNNPITIYVQTVDNPQEFFIDINKDIFSNINQNMTFDSGIVESVKIVDKKIAMPDPSDKGFYAVDFLVVYLRKVADSSLSKDKNDIILDFKIK